MYRFINRNQLIVSGIVLCCLSTYGSAQKNHPRVIDGTFGPVRSIEEWKVSSWSAGGKKRAKRTLSSRELYDRSGKLTAYTTYKDDGEVLFGDRNTYDASGRLVGTQTIHSQFVYLPDKQIYVYDDRGNLVETKGFDSTGTHLGGHLYSYDSADNLVEEMVYPIGVNLVYSNHHLTRHVYDKKGNEIGRQQYDTRAGDITPNEFGMGYQRRVFLNDNAGRPVLIGYLKADNTIGRIETVEYDSRGNTIQETERQAAGRLLRRVSYSYVFDKHGNWVKKIRREWTADGVGTIYEPLEISYRRIRYYAQPYEKIQ